jgi:transposase-like protein
VFLSDVIPGRSSVRTRNPCRIVTVTALVPDRRSPAFAGARRAVRDGRRKQSTPGRARLDCAGMTTPDLPTLKARAEQMRRAGATMAEIAREVGRAPSTLHGWAAAGGWRLAEIEELALSPSQGERMGGEAVQVRGCSTAGADPLTSILSPRGERENSAAPLSALEAAKALQQRAAQLATAGQIRAAEAAARLADRLLRTEFHLARLTPPEKPRESPEEIARMRAEIKRRLDRIRETRHLTGGVSEALPVLADGGAIEHLRQTAARGRRCLRRKGIWRRPDDFGDFIAMVRLTACPVPDDKKGDMIAAKHGLVGIDTDKLRCSGKRDSGLFAHLLFQGSAQRLAALHPAAGEMPARPVGVAHERDLSVRIDRQPLHAERHAARTAPMALHQRSQDRFEAQLPAHAQRQIAAQSLPSGALQTRLESGSARPVFLEFAMFALVALAIPFAAFGILNLIEFGRLD